MSRGSIMFTVKRLTFITMILLLLTVSGVAAADDKAHAQPAVPPGHTRFIMVLRQPGERRDSPKAVTVPDVAKLGGNVESRRDNVLVITLPLAAAKHLQDDENVAYIQRVWMGEPLDTWHGLDNPSVSSSSSKLHARALETGT